MTHLDAKTVFCLFCFLKKTSVVFIVIMQIYGYTPEDYPSLDDVPDMAKAVYKPGNVAITCFQRVSEISTHLASEPKLESIYNAPEGTSWTTNYILIIRRQYEIGFVYCHFHSGRSHVLGIAIEYLNMPLRICYNASPQVLSYGICIIVHFISISERN